LTTSVLYSFPTRRSSDLAVIGIIFQARANGTKRQLVQAIKYLVTVILITVPTYYYSYHLVTGRFSIKGFISWITYFSPENGFTLDRKSTRLNSSHVSISY